MTVKLAGGRRMPADRDTVWAALNDVDCLERCIPGCRDLRRVSDTKFELCVPVRLGPVHVAFRGTVAMFDVDAPSGYSLAGRGCGGILGAVEGTTRIMLSERLDGSRLDYAVEAEASGPLAALGELFLGCVAKTMVDQFGATLAAHLGGRPAPYADAYVEPKVALPAV